MPFIQKIVFEEGCAGIWEMAETPAELLNLVKLTEAEKTHFLKISAPKRQVEFLATRILTEKITGEKSEIVYQTDGKPTLLNRWEFISISHSANLVVVFISKLNCGVDVETINRDTDRIAKRFLHPSEMENIQKSDQPKLLQLLYWCAKEAVFKCSPQKGVQFNEQILIYPFNMNHETHFKASLTSETGTENFSLWFLPLKNNMLVFCVEMGKNEQ
jgi:phosphopantetheinyl transferase